MTTSSGMAVESKKSPDLFQTTENDGVNFLLFVWFLSCFTAAGMEVLRHQVPPLSYCLSKKTILLVEDYVCLLVSRQVSGWNDVACMLNAKMLFSTKYGCPVK